MPSLILHVDESLNYIFKKLDVNLIEKNIIDIIINELDAEKDNCQIIWVQSKIFNSNYKLYGEIKFREKKSRDVNKRERSIDSVMTQYKDTVRPMFLEFVKPTQRYADIIIPYGGKNKISIDTIVTTIKKYYIKT